MSIFKTLLASAVIAVSAMQGQAVMGAGDSGASYQLDIHPQSLSAALNKLSEETGLQILFFSELVQGVNSTEVKGKYTVDQALAVMLGGTELEYRALGEEGTITVTAKESRDTQGQSDKAILDKRSSVIEEITVTATKRAESLQDIPQSISVLGNEELNKTNSVGFDDYLRNLPGVSYQQRGAGLNQIIIRGIASRPQSSGASKPVSAYFGETPVSGLSVASNYGGTGNADLKLVDIERVEVLRGPQGTYYGAGSMGGTVRTVPVSPNLEEFEGRLATQYSHTGRRGDDNNVLQGVVNIPVVKDTLAIRGVAYRFRNSGYVDNVAGTQPSSFIDAAIAAGGGRAQDRHNVGNDSSTGFRIAALWQVTDDLDVTLSYMQEKTEQDGFGGVNMDIPGKYVQTRLRTGVDGANDEFRDIKIEIANATANYDFGWGVLTNSSSIARYDATQEMDLSFTMAAPYYSHNVNDVDFFANELRFVSSLDGPFQLIAGLYYENKDSISNWYWDWSGDPLLDPGVKFYDAIAKSVLKQNAVFGELTYNITDQLAATFGARHFEYDQDVAADFFLNGSPLFVGSETNLSEKGQTYKASLKWQPADDTIIYGLWSQGFRLGYGVIPNTACDVDQDGLVDGLGIPNPTQVDSDKTNNYELGTKTSLANNRITVNASVYRIDWDGIPVSTVPFGNCTVQLNAGKAKSEGIELEVATNLTDTLKLDLSASYGEAKLAEDASNVGNKGDDLPGSADFNFSAGLEKEFHIFGKDAFFRTDYAYVGEYNTDIGKGLPAGDYHQLHLKTGITLDDVDIDIFVRNVTNSGGYAWVDALVAAYSGNHRVFLVRPRTYGLNLSYRF